MLFIPPWQSHRFNFYQVTGAFSSFRSRLCHSISNVVDELYGFRHLRHALPGDDFQSDSQRSERDQSSQSMSRICQKVRSLVGRSSRYLFDETDTQVLPHVIRVIFLLVLISCRENILSFALPSWNVSPLPSGKLVRRNHRFSRTQFPLTPSSLSWWLQ